MRKQADRELSRLEKLPQAAAEHGVIRTYLEWIASLPWDKRTEDNLDLAHAREVLDDDHYDIEQGQGPDPRVPRRAQAQAGRQRRLDHVLRRPARASARRRSGSSIARAHGPQVRAHQRRRRARRGRDPRPPAHLHRRDAGHDHPRAARRGRQQPAVHDRRDRQDGRRLPRRPGQRDARGARPRAELDVPRPLPRRAVRPLAACCSSPRRTRWTRSRRRCATAWRSSSSRATPRRRSSRSPSATSCRARSTAPASSARRSRFTDAGLKAIIERLHARGGRAQPRARDRLASAARSRCQVAEGTHDAQGVGDRAEGARAARPRRASSPTSSAARAEPGVATGLAWTPVGGDVLFIEATAMPGKGKLTITGQLGDVMKESAQAALSYVRGHARRPARGLVRHPRHPRPRARRARSRRTARAPGITMATALMSLVTGRPVRDDMAMTGELTLTGQVLPIGGLKEKALAAQRAGVKRVLAPTRNEAGPRGHPRGAAQGPGVRVGRRDRRGVRRRTRERPTRVCSAQTSES